MWQIQGLQVQGKHLYIYQLHRLLLKTQLMMTLIIYQKYHNYQHDHCIKDYYKSIKSCNARNDVPNMSIPSLSYMGLKKPSTNWINHQVIKNVTATGKRTTLWIGNIHQKLVREIHIRQRRYASNVLEILIERKDGDLAWYFSVLSPRNGTLRKQEYPTSQWKYIFLSYVVDKAKSKIRDFDKLPTIQSWTSLTPNFEEQHSKPDQINARIVPSIRR